MRAMLSLCAAHLGRSPGAPFPLDEFRVPRLGRTTVQPLADVPAQLLELGLLQASFSSIRRNASRTTSLADVYRPESTFCRTMSSRVG